MRFLKDLYARWAPEAVRNYVRPFKSPRKLLVRTRLEVWTHGRVAEGSFAGMKFPKTFPTGMLLGTWEKELRPAWQEILTRDYHRVVNVGAAEGYYAVGLLLKHSRVRVDAFEMLPEQQRRLRELAVANGVADRLRVFGRCELENFTASVGEGEHTLIVMDVEGYETVLLDPEKIPALAAADLLVECHDVYIPGCAELLRRRFERTHQLTAVAGQWRTFDDFPFKNRVARLAWLRGEVIATMNEGRPCLMSWFWMKSRQNS
jgi:hypothetical protein